MYFCVLYLNRDYDDAMIAALQTLCFVSRRFREFEILKQQLVRLALCVENVPKKGNAHYDWLEALLCH
jgi:hypothetical protein